MQRFSWWTCTVRATGANIECQKHKLLVGFWGIFPSEIFKIYWYYLKCNFLHSLDWNWLTLEVFWNNNNLCELLDLTCQTTGRCVWYPAWNKTPAILLHYWSVRLLLFTKTITLLKISPDLISIKDYQIPHRKEKEGKKEGVQCIHVAFKEGEDNTQHCYMYAW